MAIDRRLRALAIAALLPLGACVKGLLYTDVTYPLTEHFRSTPVGAKRVELDIKQISEPIFTGIAIRWDSNAIGDIAKKYGLDEVYFADIRTFSIILGLWGTETVILCGREAPAYESEPASREGETPPASKPGSVSTNLEKRSVPRDQDVGP